VNDCLVYQDKSYYLCSRIDKCHSDNLYKHNEMT